MAHQATSPNEPLRIPSKLLREGRMYLDESLSETYSNSYLFVKHFFTEILYPSLKDHEFSGQSPQMESFLSALR
jgi:hypothetical protein